MSLAGLTQAVQPLDHCQRRTQQARRQFFRETGIATVMNYHRSGIAAGAFYLRAEIRAGRMKQLVRIGMGLMMLDVKLGCDSLWAFIRGPGDGGYALRTAHAPGGLELVETHTASDQLVFRVAGATGTQEVRLEVVDHGPPLVRATTILTPDDDLLLHYWPQDLYPLGPDDDPMTAKGRVEAAQRGFNAPVVFLNRAEDGLGSLLYFQNLASLNPYFRVTATRPDGVVGGRWPQLGYQPPTAPLFDGADDHPLPAGHAITISDAYLAFGDRRDEDPRWSALTFLDLLATIYPHLMRPSTDYRDWPALAVRTAADIRRSSKVSVRHYGHLYLRPYTRAEVPDSMVQLAVARPVAKLAEVEPRYRPLADALLAGIDKFYDSKLGTMRRFLPNVVAESRALSNPKDPGEVDSWYLYHPLINLAILARQGHEQARRLLLGSIDYAIKVAKRFRYCWPIKFNVRTLKIIKRARKEGDPGQSDVGGIYAHLLLDVWELTGDKRYLDEAAKAIRACRDLRFDLTYQTNLTAFGTVACLRLWKATGDRYFLDESYVFLASFLHNSLFWESELKAATHYPTFMGATCLHDGPYMAIYECFESWESFRHFLVEGRDDLPHSVRLLLSEYCRYTLDRAWFYYPAHLPAAVFGDKVRNGEIDRKLAFPLEDLYAAGDPPGQVGQEIYGSGAAFSFSAGAWRRLATAPFTLFTDYPIATIEERRDAVSFETVGVAGMQCRVRLVAKSSRRKTPCLRTLDETSIPLSARASGHWEAMVPATATLTLTWDN